MKYVWVVILTDTDIRHSCRSCLVSVYETEELAISGKAQLDKGEEVSHLVYEIERKILYRVKSL